MLDMYVRPHSEANVAAQEATQRFMENVMVVDASVKRGSLLVKAMVLVMLPVELVVVLHPALVPGTSEKLLPGLGRVIVKLIPAYRQ